MDYKLYYNINEIQHSNKDIQIQDLDKNVDIAKQELYTLWQECFGDSNAYTDFYFDWKVKDNQILSIYKPNKLSSMLHLNPYALMVRGKRILANYIVGVATRTQDRRQGLMKLLLEAALHQMYQEHMPFTYLMPAAEAIYLPFGFRIVYEQEPWNQLLKEAGHSHYRKDILHNKMAEDLTIVALKTDDSERTKELVTFSNLQLSLNYDIYTERTSYYYSRLLHEMESTGGEVLLCYRREKLVGYASYMAEGDIYVTEGIYGPEEKEAVMDAIYEFIAKIIGRNNITMKKENHEVPTIMVRIVDLQSFLQDISATEEITLILEVTDPIVNENNGVYALQFTEQGCEVLRTEEKPEVSADIAELSRLFFGRLDKSELVDIICGADKREIECKLQKINSYKKLFINDVV